jgi:hypothetical protein
MHSAIFGQESKGKIDFTISPDRLIKRSDKDNEQVSMVLVSAAFDGSFWKIKVSVLKGEFYDKGEQEVGAYSARESEKVTINEMGPLGVEPFDVSVVRLNQSAAIRPDVKNKTKSIEVMNVVASTVPNPYHLLLRNLSDKPVLALEVNTYVGNRLRFLAWPQGPWDHPIIEPGGTYDVGITSEGKGETTAYGYVPEQSTSVEIGAVVFADGTYEGNPLLAAVIKAQMTGCKIQLSRVLPLLQSALDGVSDNPVRALQEMKERVLAAREEVESSQLKELQDQFSNLGAEEKKNLAGSVKWGLHYVKVTVGKEIDAFEKGNRQMSGETIREWLLKTKERYEKWFAAL